MLKVFLLLEAEVKERAGNQVPVFFMWQGAVFYSPGPPPETDKGAIFGWPKMAGTKKTTARKLRGRYDNQRLSCGGLISI